MNSMIINKACYVFGLTLDGKGGAKEFDGNFTVDQHHWVHLDYTFNDCGSTLDELNITEGIAESLTREDTRPRAITHHKDVLLTLRAINKNPEGAPDDMVSLRILMQGNIMISLRHRRVQTAQQIRKSLLAGNGPENLQEILADLIEKIADNIADYVDQIEEDISLIEDELQIVESAVSLKKLSEIRRQSASVRRFLAPQREALESLHRNTRELFKFDILHKIQEVSDRISRYVEDLDLVREKSLLAKEDVQNQIAQSQNARMYILSIVAAIFLPISFVTGLFGMNVAGLPGTENPAGFIYVAGIMTAMVLGILLLFKKKSWF